MTKLIRWAMTGSALLVSACGGSGNSGSSTPIIAAAPTATPTPVPTPIPTPTPTSTSIASPTLLSLNDPTTLYGFVGGTSYTRPADGSISYTFGEGYGPATVATYAGGQLSYILPNNITVYDPFKPATPLTRSVAETDQVFEVLRGSSGGIDQYFSRLRTGPTNPTLPLLYSSVLRHFASSAQDGVLRRDSQVVSLGLRRDNRQGLSGTATYQGIVLGIAVKQSDLNVYEVSGSIVITLPYESGLATGTITLKGKDDRTGEEIDFGTYSFTPDSLVPVYQDFEFEGNIKAGDTIRTWMAGPQAEELYGGFNVHIADPKNTNVIFNVANTFAAKR